MFWLCAFGVSVGLLAAQPAPQSEEFLLTPGKAWRVDVGVPVDELYDLVGRDNTRLVDLYYEGMFSPALEIRLPGSPGMVALVVPIREWPCRTFSVQGIEVRDPRFRTREGVGVGSTLGEVQKYYRVTLSNEEGYNAHAAAIRMTFRLESATRTGAARVRSVWIYADPGEIRQARCPN